MSKIDYAFSIK